ncbi:MFS transporter [Teichococcus oryzae]|nr:MFS transporter [Pseudoroseomonas oryzae]
MDGRWKALAVLATARLSLGFQFQSIASVSTRLIEDLGLAYVDLGFLIGLYVLPGVILALPGGALGQRFGDKRVVMTGLALMTGGGVLAGLAEDYATLVAGRLLSGVGGVLLNVLMAKMVTDWFAGREIVLAMALFVNSFPVGIGLALLVLGLLTGAGAAWPVGLYVSAATAAAAFLLLALAYRRHPNDRSGATSAGTVISGHEIILVSLAGMMWGLYNGAFGIMLGFAPLFLISSGFNPGQAGALVGTTTWLMVASGQIGGLAAQRWGRPRLLLLTGTLAWGIGMLLLPSAEPVSTLLTIGLLMGLPVGVIMSLPAAVLRPGSRALGMGIFYTWLYAGQSGLPPAAGWLQDLSGNPATSLYFAGSSLLTIPLLYASFVLRSAKRQLPA